MENIHYVDSHAHLMGEEFQNDLDTVLEKTKAHRVDRIMIITLKEEEARRAKAFVQSQEGKGLPSCPTKPAHRRKMTMHASRRWRVIR